MVNIEKLKQEIREKAYYLWLDAGKPQSDGLEFWLEAEAEAGLAQDSDNVKVKDKELVELNA